MQKKEPGLAKARLFQSTLGRRIEIRLPNSFQGSEMIKASEANIWQNSPTLKKLN
jgi:hypothetical protein